MIKTPRGSWFFVLSILGVLNANCSSGAGSSANSDAVESQAREADRNSAEASDRGSDDTKSNDSAAEAEGAPQNAAAHAADEGAAESGVTAQSLTANSTPTSTIPLGTNLGELSSYSTQAPFRDLLVSAGGFVSTNAPGAAAVWDTQVMDKIAVDEHGYPLSLPVSVEGASAPQAVRTATQRPLYPGRYVLTYEGEGEFSFPSSPVTVIKEEPGRLEVEIGESDTALFVSIVSSTEGNHVHDMHLVAAEAEATYQEDPFHPDFVKSLEGVSTVRFMDWARTNGSDNESWAERTVPGDFEGGDRGMSIETMIDTANRVGAAAWLNVPHKADDEYVHGMAKVACERISEDSPIYVEYSNEVWNTIFAQSTYVQDQGCEAGLNQVGSFAGECSDAGSRYWAGAKWNARRSAEIFKIFSEECGDHEIVRVLGSHSANPTLTSTLLEAIENPEINPLAGDEQAAPDAVAIAPYVGGSLANRIAEEGGAASVTVDAIIDELLASIDTQVRADTRENKAFADEHGVRLVGYEGGQHLVVFGPPQDDEAYVQKLIEVNRDPRMATVYEKMLDAWYEESGDDLMVLFTHIYEPTKYGMWGLLESQTDVDEGAPKYDAFRARVEELQAAQ
jgi:hypothetical protein